MSRGDEEDPHCPEAYLSDQHWKAARRPPWQRHSELGPNLDCQGTAASREALQDVVNPPDADYASPEWTLERLEALRARWEAFRRVDADYTDHSLTRAALRDIFQQLFVSIVLGHVDALLSGRTSPSPSATDPP